MEKKLSAKHPYDDSGYKISTNINVFNRSQSCKTKEPQFMKIIFFL